MTPWQLSICGAIYAKIFHKTKPQWPTTQSLQQWVNHHLFMLTIYAVPKERLLESQALKCVADCPLGSLAYYKGIWLFSLRLPPPQTVKSTGASRNMIDSGCLMVAARLTRHSSITFFIFCYCRPSKPKINFLMEYKMSVVAHLIANQLLFRISSDSEVMGEVQSYKSVPWYPRYCRKKLQINKY